MKFIITESQAKRILEIKKEKSGNQNQLDFDFETKEDYLHLLCKRSRKSKGPACKLFRLRRTLNDELKTELNNSIEILFNFFGQKHVGILPKVIELSLQTPDRTVYNLKTIADFIDEKVFNHDTTKKQLASLKDLQYIPNNLEDILRDARIKEYTKYENEFVGNYFDAKRTSLSLKYKCGDNIEDKFIDLVGKSENLNSEEYKNFLNEILVCISESIEDSPTLKADVVSKTPLYIEEDGQKIEVFPSGSNFEIKKMDTNIDSYLSEFFSIFKNKENILKKDTHLALYNRIIQDIFKWIVVNGDNFLNKVKNELEGIIYDNYTIIPIKYIEFYWSNQGQRNCEVEKRLSIRFRINPEFKGQTIPTYIFNKNSDILEKKEKVISPNEVKYIRC